MVLLEPLLYTGIDHLSRRPRQFIGDNTYAYFWNIFCQNSSVQQAAVRRFNITSKQVK